MKKLVIASMIAAAFGMAQAGEKADVVVIGAGGAGMAAAITAHDAGAKVVIMLLKLRSRPSSASRTALSRCIRIR